MARERLRGAVSTADAPISTALTLPTITGIVAASPDTVTTRFGRRSPGDDLTAVRFTGSATRAVPGTR